MYKTSCPQIQHFQNSLGKTLYSQNWALLFRYFERVGYTVEVFAGQADPWFYVHTVLGYEGYEILAKDGDSNPSFLGPSL